MDTQLADIESRGNAKRDVKVKRPSHLNDQTEAAVVRQLDRMLAAAKLDKFKVAGDDHENWNTLFDFYLGGKNHWKGYPARLTGGQQFTDNRLGRNIVMAEELLEEMHIAADVQPREPGDEAAAAVVDERWKYVLNREHNQEAIARASLWARILGCGFYRVDWNADLEDGVGDWELNHIPSHALFCEPESRDIDGARYWCYVRRMDATEAETRYGVDAEEIEGTFPEPEEYGERAGAETGGAAERAYEVAAPGETQPTTTTYLLPARGYISADDRRDVELQEWWVRGDRKRWPNGRHIVRLGRHVVVDEEYEYECGKWPLVVIWDQRDPKRVWGDCSARQVIEQQRELNLSRSLEIQNFHINVNTPLVNWPQTGIETTDLMANAGVAGYVFEGRNPGVIPLPLTRPNMWSQSLNHIDAIIESIDKNQRIQDVIPPGARGYPSSGEVIRELRESQLVTIRSKAGFKGKALRRTGEIAISLMAQFYTTERFIRLTGPVPEHLAGLIYNPENEELTPEILAGGTHWLVLDKEDMKHGFDMVVTPTSWEPLSKHTQIQEIKELAKEEGFNTIYPSDILELEGGPQVQTIRRRVRQREEAAMKAEQAQAQPALPMQGMPPPPMPMPPVPMGGGM